MKRKEINWWLIEKEYRFTERSVRDIAKSFGIARSTLTNHAGNYGWTRQKIPPDRGAGVSNPEIIDRLRAQVVALAERVDANTQPLAACADVVSKLAATLRTLATLPTEAPGTGLTHESTEMLRKLKAHLEAMEEDATAPRLPH